MQPEIFVVYYAKFTFVNYILKKKYIVKYIQMNELMSLLQI